MRPDPGHLIIITDRADFARGFLQAEKAVRDFALLFIFNDLKSDQKGVRRMNKKNRRPRLEMLYKAILSLKTVDECMRFFDDLCTVQELQALEQRFDVAWLLNKGLVYNDIMEETGASSATISRVKRSLQYGHDGYPAVFERLAREIEADPRGKTGR